MKLFDFPLQLIVNEITIWFYDLYDKIFPVEFSLFYEDENIFISSPYIVSFCEILEKVFILFYLIYFIKFIY